MGLVFLLCGTFALYYPGLGGPFIFDDVPNLSPLGYAGGVVSWQAVLFFVFGGHAGPLGRPLSLLSFLINDFYWPTDPYGFKYTNVMIHLLNGVLVFILGRQIGKILFPRELRKGDLLALSSTAIWLVHPIQVSATLFVVQRMTLFSSTFILLSLISYLHYRMQNYSKQSVVKCCIAVGAFTLSGMFVKENAAMAVFYIAVIEISWIKRREGLWEIFYWLVLGGCSILITTIIISALSNHIAWAHRDFTPLQRLMTEARILWAYFFAIVVPRPSNFGLFYDDYLISKSFLDPPLTSVAIISWVLLFSLSLLLRRKWRLLLFAVCWFLGGHIMESTIVPLELYFDHRNYLPMLGWCWLVMGVLQQFSNNSTRALTTLLPILSLFCFVTYSNVMVWSSEKMMAKIWAVEHPASPRAQQFLVKMAIFDNDGKKAKLLIDEAVNNHPDNAHLALQKIAVSCLLKESVNIRSYFSIFAKAPQNNGVIEGLSQLQGLVVGNDCAGFDAKDMLALYEVVLNNKNYNEPALKSAIYIQLATLATGWGDLDMAIKNLDLAYQNDPTNLQIPLTQAYWLADAGLFEDAKGYIKIAESTPPPNYFQHFFYQKLVDDARKNIKKQKALKY